MDRSRSLFRNSGPTKFPFHLPRFCGSVSNKSTFKLQNVLVIHNSRLPAAQTAVWHPSTVGDIKIGQFTVEQIWDDCARIRNLGQSQCWTSRLSGRVCFLILSSTDILLCRKLQKSWEEPSAWPSQALNTEQCATGLEPLWRVTSLFMVSGI